MLRASYIILQNPYSYQSQLKWHLMKITTPIDSAGFTLSVLCVIHCLFLPIIGTGLPILGALSEIEWLHKALVLFAVPIAISLIISTKQQKVQIMAIFGIVLLFAAAFFPGFHDVEKLMTAIGGLSLALAHLSRPLRKNHFH